MLSDRSYMREPQPGGRTSVVGWLLAAVAAGFILQNFLTKILGQGQLLERTAGLSAAALRSGHLWTLLTYGFLHPQDELFLLEVIFIGLSIYFLGKELLPVLGPRRFLALYAATLVVGGLFWTAANWRNEGTLLGASSAVAGLLVVFACFFPNREITLLFLFVPVTVKPKYIVLCCLTLDLFGCVFYEILGKASPLGLAHSAHLGGMAAGWLYYRFGHQAAWRRPGRAPAIELPRWMKRTAPPAVAPAPAYQVNIGSREHLRAEVDRILDKINSQGFGALTADEKRLLDEAKDLLSRR